jgi:dolichol-phosphate mannosyltransferase
VTTPEVSIVVPALDEAAALPSLLSEIAKAFAGRAYEIIVVDDGSRDDTRQTLVALRAETPGLRAIAHRRTAGQSRAIRSGVLAATAPLIVTLDGDGQNDPADAAALLAMLSEEPAIALAAGQRFERRDSLARRAASRLGNGVRRLFLHDGAVDTACGLKAFRREAYLRLPYFDHMHRFLPALFQREGLGVAYAPVRSRPRSAGVSKYSNLGRLRVSIWDLVGVAWLRARARDPGGLDEL